MNVIALDIPVLIIGLSLLLWARVYRSEQNFQILCQFVATFAAQYSFGVSWSLARLVPIISATGVFKARSVGLGVYLPFVTYVVISSLIASLFWNIPQSVSFWYGQGRVFLQLFNFIVLVASCAALASAIAQEGGTRILIFFLQLAAVIHGVASAYQLIASATGLPMIGISRAHDLAVGGGVGDIAVFVTKGGEAIFRPGGLMGEPKTAAVLFGIVLLHGIFTRISNASKRTENIFQMSAVIFSAFGFLAAFSTSGFLGFGAALVVCLLLISSATDRTKSIFRISIVVLLVVFGWFVIYEGSIDSLVDILLQRTTDRFEDQVDPPVEASVRKIIDNPWVALFGVGQGGSSFLVMEFIGLEFDYAYAPNVGLVLLAVESGLIGSIAFLGVFFFQVLRVGYSPLVKSNYEIRALFIIGVSAMFLCLTGSGIPLGFPLAVACMAVATYKVNRILRINF